MPSQRIIHNIEVFNKVMKLESEFLEIADKALDNAIKSGTLDGDIFQWAMSGKISIMTRRFSLRYPEYRDRFDRRDKFENQLITYSYSLKHIPVLWSRLSEQYEIYDKKIREVGSQMQDVKRIVRYDNFLDEDEYDFVRRKIVKYLLDGEIRKETYLELKEKLNQRAFELGILN